MKSLFKKFHKALTVVMCLALVVETINLTSISAVAADGGSTVTTSGNDIITDDVSGNDVSGNAPVVEDVSGNDVSGNDVSGNYVSGNDVSGNDVSGNVPTEDVSGNDVSGNDVPVVSEETQKAEDELTAIAQQAVDATWKKLDSANKLMEKANTQFGRAESCYNKIAESAGLTYPLIGNLSKLEQNASYAQGSAERAKADYEAAQEQLAKSVEKFETSLVKAQESDENVTGDAAKALLAQAQANVDATEEAYEKAQANADAAKNLVAQAQAIFDGKEVVANFYVLNRGLEQPEEITKQPKANYSHAVTGKLLSGVETDGVRDNSYLELYYNGLVSDVYTYIVEAPTAEDFGIELAENEDIVWYVIKTESGVIHVNGIITVVEGDENNSGDDNNGGNDNNPPAGNNNPPAGNNNPPAGNNNPPTGNTPVQEQPQDPAVVEPEENEAVPPVEDVEETEEETETVDETTETEIAEDVEDSVVEIEDEEVALSSGTEDITDVVVEIEDEEVPLAGHDSCMIHWIILLVTLLYTVFELVRGISRGKRISELKAETENEMA